MLMEIMTEYPKIPPLDVTLAVPILYPIAIMQMDYSETVMEDLDEIQRKTLELLSLGYQKDEVGKLMGLQKEYVEACIQLLAGNNLYSYHRAEITELGKKAIREGHFKKTVKARTKVQLDPINLSLLPRKRAIAKNMLFSREDIQFFRGKGESAGRGDSLSSYRSIILPLQRITDGGNQEDVRLHVGDLVDEIERRGFDTYIGQGKESAHVSLAQIESIQCIEIMYTKGCFLRMINGEFLFFVKKYIEEKREDGIGYHWKIAYEPLAGTSKTIMAYQGDGGLSYHIPPATDAYIRTIESSLGIFLTKKNRRKRNRKEIGEILTESLLYDGNIHIEQPERSIHEEDGGERILVTLSSASFCDYRKTSSMMIPVLMAWARNKTEVFLYSNERLMGKIIYLQPNREDFLLVDAIQEIKNFVEKKKKKNPMGWNHERRMQEEENIKTKILCETNTNADAKNIVKKIPEILREITES